MKRGRFNIGEFFRFSRRETRGVLWLLPLLAAIAAVWSSTSSVDGEEWRVESVIPSETSAFSVIPRSPKGDVGISQRKEASFRALEAGVESASEASPRSHSAWRSSRRGFAAPQDDIRPFDPNKLTIIGFEALGFSRRQAQALINYRTARGGFRTVDDFGRSFVVSPAMMERLRPYIVIASEEPAATSVNDAAAPTAEKKLLDINTADSAALRTVSGIGNVLVVRVLQYRQRLGGYADIEQLREIPGMTPENFERIRPQIFADSAVIQKINANFAPADVLGKHPYITADMLRKLLKNRQLKGGWSTTKELVEQNIITEDQARRLDPYLIYER